VPKPFVVPPPAPTCKFILYFAEEGSQHGGIRCIVLCLCWYGRYLYSRAKSHGKAFAAGQTIDRERGNDGGVLSDLGSWMSQSSFQQKIEECIRIKSNILNCSSRKKGDIAGASLKASLTICLPRRQDHAFIWLGCSSWNVDEPCSLVYYTRTS